MVIDVKLSPETMRHLQSCRHSSGVASGVVGVIRRFDLQSLEIAVGPVGSQSLTTLRLPQLSFSYVLDRTCLHISVYRKGLPVSKAHGAAAFVLAFYFVGTGEMVVTRPFSVASKQPLTKRAKLCPKRRRGPPPRQVCALAAMSPSKEEEDANLCIDALLARVEKRQKVEGNEPEEPRQILKDKEPEEPRPVCTRDSFGDDPDFDSLFSDGEAIDYVSV
jgi:hypothetical protein